MHLQLTLTSEDLDQFTAKIISKCNFSRNVLLCQRFGMAMVSMLIFGFMGCLPESVKVEKRLDSP